LAADRAHGRGHRYRAIGDHGSGAGRLDQIRHDLVGPWGDLAGPVPPLSAVNFGWTTCERLRSTVAAAEYDDWRGAARLKLSGRRWPVVSSLKSFANASVFAQASVHRQRNRAGVSEAAGSSRNRQRIDSCRRATAALRMAR